MFIILDREITYRGDYMREIGSLPDLSFTSFNKTVKQEVVLASHSVWTYYFSISKHLMVHPVEPVHFARSHNFT